MNYFGFVKLNLIKSKLPIWLKYSVAKPNKIKRLRLRSAFNSNGVAKNKKRFFRLSKLFLNYFQQIENNLKYRRCFYLNKMRKLNNFIKLFNFLKKLKYRRYYKLQFRERHFRTFLVLRNAPSLFSLKCSNLSIRYKYYLQKYYKFYFKHFHDLKFAPAMYLLLRKTLFSLFKNRLNFRYFFSKKAFFFSKKRFKNKRKKWLKNKANYSIFRGFRPQVYRYLEEPRNTAKRDFFYVKSWNPVYRKYNLRNPFSGSSLLRFIRVGRYRNFGYMSTPKLYYVLANNNLTLLHRLKLLVEHQTLPISLFKTKLLLTLIDKPKVQSLYSIKSINKPKHQRLFYTLFTFLANRKVVKSVIPMSSLYWLIFKIHSKHLKLNKIYGDPEDLHKFYSVLPRRLGFLLPNILLSLKQIIIKKLYFYNYFLRTQKVVLLPIRSFLIRRYFLKKIHNILRTIRINKYRIIRLKKTVSTYSKLVTDLDLLIKFYKTNRKRNIESISKKRKIPVGIIRKKKTNLNSNQNYAIFNGKKYFYKYKDGLPATNQQNLISLLKYRKRLNLNAYFKKLAGAFLRIPRSMSNYKFLYLSPWEYRAKKREKEKINMKKLSPQETFIKKLKKAYGKRELRESILFSKARMFSFNFKNFLKRSRNYFMGRLPRTVILNRDRIYYSKWGYVKFRATNNNLFISIYNRHHKLIHCTTAWASASRRDPNRFAYKSLVFAARKLAARLWKLRFKRINVRLNSPTNFQIRIFLKTLKIKKIKVLDIFNYMKLPHNGLRPQKSRTQS